MSWSKLIGDKSPKRLRRDREEDQLKRKLRLVTSLRDEWMFEEEEEEEDIPDHWDD